MNTSQAIINFMYFGNNYPQDFILKAFGNHLGQHLTDKFSGLYSKYETQTFFRWYMELSDNNKEILNNWIETNYSYKIA